MLATLKVPAARNHFFTTVSFIAVITVATTISLKQSACGTPSITADIGARLLDFTVLTLKAIITETTAIILRYRTICRPTTVAGIVTRKLICTCSATVAFIALALATVVGDETS